jgi:hypothetical protein
MQLREITNVHVLNAAQTQTIKGGARDTRTSSSGISTYTLPIKK